MACRRLLMRVLVDAVVTHQSTSSLAYLFLMFPGLLEDWMFQVCRASGGVMMSSTA
jgi:hypothetical protein